MQLIPSRPTPDVDQGALDPTVSYQRRKGGHLHLFPSLLGDLSVIILDH